LVPFPVVVLALIIWTTARARRGTAGLGPVPPR
jgi:hypothetical protein